MTIGVLVERERRHLRRAEVATGVLLAAAITSVLVTLAAAVLARARWLSLPRGLPLSVWLAVGLVVVALSLRTCQRLRRTGSRREVARAIEEEQGLRRGALVGVLELEGQGALAERAARGVRDTLPANAPLAPAMRRASSHRAMVGAGAATAGLLVLFSASPAFGDGLRAVLRPIDAWTGRLLARPRITGAPRDLLRGSALRVRVRAPGRRVVYLDVRQTGEAWRTDTLAVDPETGGAAWTVDAVRGDLRLVVSDGRATSDSVVVHVADRPFVGAVTLHVHYPRYLARRDESLPIGETLRLPRGSVLSVAGRASVPLAGVALVAPTGERIALGARGQMFGGEFAPEHSVVLHWAARGPGGLLPDLPEPLNIEVVADSAPHVVIPDPSGDTLLVSEDPVAFAIFASDDHGIATVALRIVRTGGRDALPTVQPLARDVGTSWTGHASLDIGALHLAPGDAVAVRAEAVDASPWMQRGVSRELIVRRATSEEQRIAARALGESAVQEALAAAKEQKGLAQTTGEAARAEARAGAAPDGASSSGQQKRPMNFEAAERARRLAHAQRAMTDRVQKLRQATRQLEQQLKAAGALDTALARQLGDAQALLRQALTPELLAGMQKLESATAHLNGEQSRDALRDLAQMQQKLREQLERSAEMLKRAAHEGAMQTLGDEATEIAQRERALGDSSRRATASTAPSAAQDATRLAQRAGRLREAMDALEGRLTKDRADRGAAKTEEAGRHAAQSASEMRRAADEMTAAGSVGADKPGADSQLRDGKTSGSSASRQPVGAPASIAANEMDRAATSMRDARREQVDAWKHELTSELDQSVQEMMQLAREERSLEQKARTGEAPDERRSAQSAIEQGVDKASERLRGAGKKSALLSGGTQRAVADAKSKVSQATARIRQSTSTGSTQASALSDAADALTKAAASLARDRERANNANSASGFRELLEQMQALAQKQGQINGQAQSLFNMPNNRTTAAGQLLARQLAREERRLSEQLDEVGDAAGGDRAAQLAQEARQLADALDNGRLDGSTIARQQQLFRRLLDAGKSLQKDERDDTGKREATAASGSDVFSPGAKVDTRAALKFRPPTWEELRALSADERRAIQDYFTRLNSAPHSP